MVKKVLNDLFRTRVIKNLGNGFFPLFERDFEIDQSFV